ncbi:MAG: hypothetical protein HY903_09775 [Deltaproteobacteria bacterium]|nr:hypothetical protein [Deltaproteobacteria bacterium]
MTRVTENMVFASLTQGIRDAQHKVYKGNREVSTSLKVERPSAGPVAASRRRILDAGIAKISKMGDVAARSEVELAASDTALAEAANILARAREIAFSGASTGFSAADRRIMATEVAGLRQLLLGVANTRAGDVYVFGGFQTTAPPFLPTGAFAGDANARSAEVAPGEQVAMSGDGAAAFTAAGGIDVFALLAGLETDLAANDTAAVQGRLAGLDAAGLQVRNAQSTVGIALQIVQTSATTRSHLLQVFADSRQQTVGADPAESYVQLTQAQQALQAAVESAARVMSTLADVLKL